MTANRFEYYNYLSFHNPYYTLSGGKINLYENFDQAVLSTKNRVIDVSSVIEVLCNGYIFGDKTIIKGIHKTPWMAKPNNSFSDWDFFSVPNHEELLISETDAASRLYSLLKEEIYSYVVKHRNVGILLTGGMDSRIVACVLYSLLREGRLKDKKVFAFTWGLEDSRDVQYAKRISTLFNWEWRGFQVDAEQMQENIDYCVDRGCEFSPLHLHAMPEIAKLDNIDCVLAGSFGDSIGRGEYSGVKVEHLPLISNNLRNFGGFISRAVFKTALERSTAEVNRYHKLFPQKKKYQLFEQDMQLHYMRRMLNPCMSTINEKIPLYQVFTAPSVYSYMWKLDPTVRKDGIYRNILQSQCPELLEIPWARTGLRFPLTEGESDSFRKNHHRYGDMLRESFLNEIKSTLSSESFKNLNIFRTRSILRILKYCESQPIAGYYYEEKLLWLTCVAKMIEKYDIKSEEEKMTGDMYATIQTMLEYQAKYLLNKLKG